MSFAMQIENRDGRFHAAFAGPINEDAELPLAQLPARLSGSDVIFNFRRVTLINSCGVRAWIKFMRVIDNARVVFEECTPDIIAQINMIPNFRGNATIRSVHAPYLCETCDSQKWHLFEAGKNLPANAFDDLEDVKCGKCGSNMVMEEIPEEFFLWIKDVDSDGKDRGRVF